MIDFAQIHSSIKLAPGERITIEIGGRTAEMTANGYTVREHPKKHEALQTALTVAKLAREIRNELIYPHPDREQIKKLAEDVIQAGEFLKRWAA